MRPRWQGRMWKGPPRASYLPVSILIPCFPPHNWACLFPRQKAASQARQQPSLFRTKALSQPCRWHLWKLLCCREVGLPCQNLKPAQGDAIGAGITPVIAVNKKDLASCFPEKKKKILLVGSYLSVLITEGWSQSSLLLYLVLWEGNWILWRLGTRFLSEKLWRGAFVWGVWLLASHWRSYLSSFNHLALSAGPECSRTWPVQATQDLPGCQCKGWDLGSGPQGTAHRGTQIAFFKNFYLVFLPLFDSGHLLRSYAHLLSAAAWSWSLESEQHLLSSSLSVPMVKLSLWITRSWCRRPIFSNLRYLRPCIGVSDLIVNGCCVSCLLLIERIKWDQKQWCHRCLNFGAFVTPCYHNKLGGGGLSLGILQE